MRRDTLELADDSLFIERVKGTFTAADAELAIRAHAFLSEKACADDSTAHKAAALLIEQDADATAVAAALLPPLLWQECIDPSEIRERFGSTVAASIEDLGSPLIPTTDDDPIGLPKDNVYRSLQTCVYPVREVSRKPIEFQMRTKLMASKRPG
jgi:(p)ppGpp synthase/HD superfamily hydrolase